jgi:hypothetical protein
VEQVELRLFSAITMNWRGRPLTSHEVIIETISAVTTRTGLKVTAVWSVSWGHVDVKVDDGHRPLRAEGPRELQTPTGLANLPTENNGPFGGEPWLRGASARHGGGRQPGSGLHGDRGHVLAGKRSSRPYVPRSGVGRQWYLLQASCDDGDLPREARDLKSHVL